MAVAPEAEESLPPSRSARKRAAQRVRNDAETLASLGERALAALPLPPAIRAAVEEARRLPPTGEPRRRQLQFVAKLLRGEPDLDLPALLAAQGASAATDPSQMRLEGLRHELVTYGMPAVNALCARLPGTDRNRLRALVKTARQELAQTPVGPKPGGRRLFQFLKEQFADNHTPVPATLVNDVTGDAAPRS